MRSAVILPALCAALLGPVAWAEDLVVNEGTDTIRISEAACDNEAVLSRIEPASRPLFRAASAVLQGQRYPACWSVLPNAVYLVYEDGDQGLVPFSKLKVAVDI
jgi:hypothetical protein